MATTEDLTKTKMLLSNTDVTESRTGEGANKKLKFDKPKNVKVFATLPEEAPMVCKEIVFPNPLSKHTL